MPTVLTPVLGLSYPLIYNAHMPCGLTRSGYVAGLSVAGLTLHVQLLKVTDPASVAVPWHLAV